LRGPYKELAEEFRTAPAPIRRFVWRRHGRYQPPAMALVLTPEELVSLEQLVSETPPEIPSHHEATLCVFGYAERTPDGLRLTRAGKRLLRKRPAT